MRASVQAAALRQNEGKYCNKVLTSVDGNYKMHKNTTTFTMSQSVHF